ncbi:MAG: DNA translocase FtsK 4TM domain-containing protein [Bacteroidota bacterium]|nr:DNA translocase FtsK 4TM domain-containing protein [Bacteroidota bacterium]
MTQQSSKKEKRKSPKGNKKKSRKPAFAFLKDERFKVSIGLFFIAFAILLALSFTSFLFTWQGDQSKLDSNVVELFADSNIKVENWIGKLGAVLADVFIHDGFGIASFVFIFISLIIGFRFLKLRLLPLRKSLFLSLLGMIWLSVLLGFIFSDKLFYLGGAHGLHMAQWLNAFTGKAGIIILLFLFLFAVIIFSYNPALGIIKGWLKKIKNIKPEQLKEKEEPDLEEDPGISSEEEKDTEPTPGFEYQVDKEEAVRDEGKSNYDLEVKNTRDTEEKPAENVSLTNDGDYDPTLDLSNYKMPPLELLKDHKSGNVEVSEKDLEANSNQIIRTLQDYNIEISKISATVGPTVTMYEIVPAKGVRISKIKNLEDDIALSLAALGIRIIAPIPGRGTIGIEVPNKDPEMVSMRSVLTSKAFLDSDYELPVVMGKKINNEPLIFNLAKMPHLLMAGATGQGKSVGLNAIITSLLYKKHPAQLKFVMVDPKKIELSFYEKLERHFLAKLPEEEEPIITDTQKVIHTLNSLTKEMDQRYDLLKKAGARTIKEYNKKYIKRRLNPEKGHHYLPYIVVVVDEFADLIQTAGKEIEGPIARLAQLARAIGIHLIIATQRPSTNVITGTIKANFPARISFRVSSSIDSRTILDSSGANQLIGRGDMLINDGKELVRAQCAFVDTPEIEGITEYIGSQQGYPSALLLPEPDTESSSSASVSSDDKLDENFEEAARLVVRHQQGSTSLIQRKLSIGYNRAGRIIDQLEAMGVVGPFEGSKARKVLYPDEYALEQYLNSLNEKE